VVLPGNTFLSWLVQGDAGQAGQGHLPHQQPTVVHAGQLHVPPAGNFGAFHLPPESLIQQDNSEKYKVKIKYEE
jgi:hypothetical protein